MAHEESNNLAQTMGPSQTNNVAGGNNSPEAMGGVPLGWKLDLGASVSRSVGGFLFPEIRRGRTAIDDI